MPFHLERHHPFGGCNDLTLGGKCGHGHQGLSPLAWLRVVQNLQTPVQIPGEGHRWQTGFQSRSDSKKVASDQKVSDPKVKCKKCIKTHKTTSLHILDSNHVRSLSKQSSEKSIHTFYYRSHLGAGPQLSHCSPARKMLICKQWGPD